MTSGHYVCCIRLDEQWLLCSDEKIQAVDWSYVRRQEAYVLLY